MSRNQPASYPSAKPIVATNNPMAIKDKETPPASVTAPHLCSDAAAPRLEQSAATAARRVTGSKVRLLKTRVPSQQSTSVHQVVLSSKAAIELGFASPTERPVSREPLNAISVLCIRAPKALTASFWESKSTRKTIKFLNLSCFSRSLRIGACALHVGHHVA